MPSDQDITHQQRLLETHRRTLAHYLQQSAMFGAAYTPPHITHGIREARDGIARAKGALQGWGVAAEDLPDDAEEASHLPTSLRSGEEHVRTRAAPEAHNADVQVSPDDDVLRRLANLLSSHPTPDRLREQVLADPTLTALLTSLAGREVQSGSSVLSFGADSQLGDVQIRDVIGGNSTTFNIYFDPKSTSSQVVAPPSDQDRSSPSAPVRRDPSPSPHPPKADLPLLRANDERLLDARSLVIKRRWDEAIAAYEALAPQYRLPERDAKLFAQAQREAWTARQIATAEQAEARADWAAAISAWAALSQTYPDHPTATERHQRALAEQPLAELAQDAAAFANLQDWEAVLATLAALEQQRPGYTHPLIDLAALDQQALAGHAYAQALNQAEQKQWDAVVATLSAVPTTMVTTAMHELLAQAENEQQRMCMRSALDLMHHGAFEQAIDGLTAYLASHPADRDSAKVLAQIVETPAAPFAQRLRAAELVGRVGDPRIPVTPAQWQTELDRRNEIFGQPAGYWCYVRGGTYQIGGWRADDPSADVTIKPFWIARYPITVAQFAPFVEVGYGPQVERWWTPQGWQWKQRVNRTRPYLWGEPTYSGANQAQIGLTWYESTAYCVWLTTQMSLPTGHVIRLLTEAEWEAAAAYDGQGQRQIYPWGAQEPTPDLAIYDASKIDRPAPVGCCPAGVAACGAMDLAGNVWEWTSSRFAEYPAPSNRVETDFVVGEGDVPLRGGGWWDDSSDVCFAAQIRFPPNDDYLDWGIRVCVAPHA